jgi:hypothetical protein
LTQCSSTCFRFRISKTASSSSLRFIAFFFVTQGFFQSIDELQQHGINAADIAKLKSAGIATVKGISMQTKKTLCNIKGISEAKIEKIREAARKITVC